MKYKYNWSQTIHIIHIISLNNFFVVWTLKAYLVEEEEQRQKNHFLIACINSSAVWLEQTYSIDSFEVYGKNGWLWNRRSQWYITETCKWRISTSILFDTFDYFIRIYSIANTILCIVPSIDLGQSQTTWIAFRSFQTGHTLKCWAHWTKVLITYEHIILNV